MQRSWLFVPATKERMIQKALGCGADAVILDLEDAVAESEKDLARQLISKALCAPRTVPIYVRVNGVATAHCWDDLLALATSMPDGIVLPKVDGGAQITTVDWVLAQLERRARAQRASVAT